MNRINTCFLKKEENDIGVINKIKVIELVKSNLEKYHVFENYLNTATGEFSKVEICVVFKDFHIASDMYQLSIENSMYGNINSGYVLAQDGDSVYGLSSLLDYTEKYVDSVDIPIEENVTPKQILTEELRQIET
jgi:hypothetical protein